MSDSIELTAAELTTQTDASGVREALTTAIVDFICDDVLPSYDVDSKIGRQDPELYSAVRTAILSALEPAAPEGRQEPVMWQWRTGKSSRHTPDVWDWTNWREGRKPDHVEDRQYRRYEERPLYTRPSEQAVTEVGGICKLLGELRQFVDAVAGVNRPSREWAIQLRTAIDALPEAALKAAMEAGR